MAVARWCNVQTLYQNPEVREYVRQKTEQLRAQQFSGASAQPVFQPHDPEYQLPYLLGNSAGRMANRAAGPASKFLTRLGNDVGGTTLTGAGIGAGLGAGIGFLRGNASKGALLGAGSGGLLIYLLNRLAQYRDNQINATYGKRASVKQSFYGMTETNPEDLIESKIQSDTTLPSWMRSQLLQFIPQLSDSEARSLASLLRSSAGGGVGYVVAKYLLGLGFTGRVLSALAGAYLGFMIGGLPNNSQGQEVDTKKDVFGRPRFV